VEIANLPGRVLMLFEYDHFVRNIFTDGREHAKDLPGTWMGDSTGKWEKDTLVVDTTGFNDKTWLGATGYPHSEDMRVTERYRRVDHDTILYNITVDDPKAYTRPIVGPQRTMKLRPKAEMEELVCVWSEENSFAKRIREPAAAQPKK